MSKQLTKEEMKAYQKSRRDKLRVCKADVKPVKPVCKAPVLDVKPCEECKAYELEVKKLLARISLLELEVQKRVHTAVVSDGDVSIGLPRLKPLGSNYKPNSLYGA